MQPIYQLLFLIGNRSFCQSDAMKIISSWNLDLCSYAVMRVRLQTQPSQIKQPLIQLKITESNAITNKLVLGI